jgi:hypothetical protein
MRWVVPRAFSNIWLRSAESSQSQRKGTKERERADTSLRFGRYLGYFNYVIAQAKIEPEVQENSVGIRVQSSALHEHDNVREVLRSVTKLQKQRTAFCFVIVDKVCSTVFGMFVRRKSEHQPETREILGLS